VAAQRWNLAFKAVLIGTLALTVSRCGSSDTGSDVKTDLGFYGNKQIETKFNAYRAKAAGCKAATTTNKRAIVTGFGLFSGVSYNISGVVVSTMADAAVTASSLDSESESFGALSAAPHAGTIKSADAGAKVVNRTMKLDGVSYDICFITMDVIWDLAAAIITYEAEAFKPDVIVMTGRGGSTGIFEGGARNHATASTGYDSMGNSAWMNTPYQSYILANRYLNSEIAMTWNSKLVYEKNAALIDDLGLSMTYAPASRPSNNYICNNVSYVVLEAAKGTAISLAGGRIKMYPTAAPKRAIGFMHLPDHATNSRTSVANWIKVLANTIRVATP
jgi:hypothetical protein